MPSSIANLIRPFFFSILTLSALFAPASSPARVKSESGQYKGTIANYPIRMTLRRQGSRLSGSYTYVRNGMTLTLRGRLLGSPGRAGLVGTEFELDEYDPKGRRSGGFQGHFTTSDMVRGSWWKTERPGRRLSFVASGPASRNDPFAGSWSYAKGGMTFSLDLARRGGRMDGSYCAVTPNATRVDCVSPLSGRVSGDVATVTFTSAYGGGSGTARITRRGDRLHWTLLTRPRSDFYAPPDATLRRTRR